MCWLHRSAYSCSAELVCGKETTKDLKFLLRFVKLLQLYELKPIVVFDGAELPAKAAENASRNESRRSNKQRAMQLQAQGKHEEAQDYFRRAVRVTDRMIRNFMRLLDHLACPYLVAPFEGKRCATLSETFIVVGSGCANGALVPHWKCSTMHHRRLGFVGVSARSSCTISCIFQIWLSEAAAET